MKKWWTVLLWVITQFRSTTCSRSGNEVLCISINNCSNHYSCQNLTTEIPQTIENVSNMKLKFCSDHYVLEKVVKVSNSNFIAIEGHPTVILCTDSGPNGIHVSHVINLKLVAITIRSCKGIFQVYTIKTKTSQTIHFATSVFIENSTNITLEMVGITESRGSGLTMINNGGSNELRDSAFYSNYQANSSDFLSGGAGVQIELSSCGYGLYYGKEKCQDSNFEHLLDRSEYTITNCRFFNNVRDSKLNKNIHQYSSWVGGGGLSVVMSGDSHDHKIKIIESNFTQNSATWGGGLYVAINGHATNFMVEIKSCVFKKNLCNENAGGGANMGFLFKHNQHSLNNSIAFRDCDFVGNKAFYGGGVSFFSSRSTVKTNQVSFDNCHWTENKAAFGAALELAPQNWNAGVFDLKQNIEIKNCVFRSNEISEPQNSSGKGTVWVQGFRVLFFGHTTFSKNNGSAMYILSAEIEFRKHSNVSFVDNSGFQGGAMAIIGPSKVSFNDNSIFKFVNNVAQDGGGAIFHVMYNKRDIYTSKTCFLRNSGKNYNSTKFVFENNSGSLGGRRITDLSHFGNSIYSTTLIPCNLKDEKIIKDDIFSQRGNFTFVDKNAYDLSTSENVIIMKNHHVYSVPGKYIKLSIDTRDELNNRIATVYHVTVSNFKNSNVSVDSDYTYISNDWVIFYGNPGDTASVTLKTITVREKSIQFKLELQSCPPGYVYDKNNGKGICICSAEKNIFEGISSCNSTAYYSFLLGGYWVGYEQNHQSNNASTKESNLLMSYCPLQHCFRNSFSEMEHALPQISSRKELDTLICGGAWRTGILCSECMKGYVVYYHSDTSECRPVNNNCKLGWLFYILSDIVPVTLLFIAIIIFEVQLTSGSVNGLILFIQISNQMRLQNNGFIVFPEFAKTALNIYSTIANMLRLSFFQTDKLAFCLSESASNMDVVAVKYFTLFYTLVLIVTVVVALRFFNFKQIRRIRSKFRQNNVSSSLIHGISGFLVLCYSESTITSLFILRPVHLYSMNHTGLYWRKTVPFYDGTLVYFQSKHLTYALPALAIFLVVSIFSPLLLLSYPLCYRVFACLRISEAQITRLLCKIIPLQKCKPFFDSFQGSFKDSFRFFSGLYFVYRLTTLLSLAFISKPMTFYIFLEGQFILIILIHAIFQPHREKWHSTLDVLLFANLSFINLLTMLNQDLSYNFSYQKKYYISVISIIQVVLLYIPLLYFCILMAYKVKQRIQSRKHKPIGNEYHRFSVSLMNAAEDREKVISLTSF